MAVDCQTFSLVHLPIISSLVVAIAIVRGDREGNCRGQLKQPQWRVSSHLERWLLRPEIASPYQPLYTEGASAPTEAIRMQQFKAN